jgi:Na+/serine symporter
VAMAPALTLTAVGVTLTLKSGAAPTRTVIVALRDNVSLIPVIVTEYSPAGVLEATATMSAEVAEV